MEDAVTGSAVHSVSAGTRTIGEVANEVRAASLMDSLLTSARAGAAGSTAVALVATMVTSNPEDARTATRRLTSGWGRVKPDGGSGRGAVVKNIIVHKTLR